GLEAERKRVRILPVKVNACELPLLLRDKKCADISADYGMGVSELVRAIHGHSSRYTAKSRESLSINRYTSTKRRGKIAYLQTMSVILALLALAGFLIYRVRNSESKVYELDSNKTAFYEN